MLALCYVSGHDVAKSARAQPARALRDHDARLRERLSDAECRAP
jgi:hypothetical protein